MLLGPPPEGDGSSRRGYGPSVFKECGTDCVYCGLPMGESYRSWLQISVDHVVPLRMSSSGYPFEWLTDITNCVTACRACNDYLQDHIPDPPPASLESFFDLRDEVFMRKLASARKRHEVERRWFVEHSELSAVAEPDWLIDRADQARRFVGRLLSTLPLPFDSTLRGRLPEEPGIYAIREKTAEPGVFLRAGRAEGAGGLRQRVYMNHLMGEQSGNLRAQLVRAGDASDIQDAKLWVRNRCIVQVAVVADAAARRWAEYATPSLLQPKFCD
jgi:HNH endonuclease